MRLSGAADLLARLAVAFAFLYPPAAALIDPYAWIGYFPLFMRGIVPDGILLHSFGIIEVVLGLWILSGRRIFAPSLIAGIISLCIVVMNLTDFDLLFRDVSIALMALSLAAAHRPRTV